MPYFEPCFLKVSLVRKRRKRVDGWIDSLFSESVFFYAFIHAHGNTVSCHSTPALLYRMPSARFRVAIIRITCILRIL